MSGAILLLVWIHIFRFGFRQPAKNLFRFQNKGNATILGSFPNQELPDFKAYASCCSFFSFGCFTISSKVLPTNFFLIISAFFCFIIIVLLRVKLLRVSSNLRLLFQTDIRWYGPLSVSNLVISPIFLSSL